MTFLWPQLLWLLLAVPAAVAAYVYALSRKKAVAAKYASLRMLKDAMAAAPAYRRHLPPLVFLLALITMLLAIARPAAVISLPSQHETVILAMDVSGSMRATDVEPNRLAAAQAAARTFVAEQPRSTRIGVVAFAATALVVQRPTQKREDILAAIDRLQLQRGTAIGSGIIISLGAIFPDAGITLESVDGGSGLRRRPAAPLRPDPMKGEEKAAFAPVAPGSFSSAAIILLTDGQRTTGPDAIEASRIASERGVRVYTVGIGTPDGEVMAFEGWRMRVRLDEETLKSVANITRGQYFYAGTASDLQKVYQALNSRFVLEKKETEVTALFSAFAALLAVISAMLSLLWFDRIF